MLGAATTHDLFELQEVDMDEIGMKKLERRRMLRYLEYCPLHIFLSAASPPLSCQRAKRQWEARHLTPVASRHGPAHQAGGGGGGTARAGSCGSGGSGGSPISAAGVTLGRDGARAAPGGGVRPVAAHSDRRPGLAGATLSFYAVIDCH